MLPLSKFLTFIEKNGLFDPQEKVLLAVSGGKDSVLMSHLFNEARFAFGIAHCNFGLRGVESDEDEEFTKALANKFNVPFYSTHFETEQISREQKISIQMAARDLRYNWFEKIRMEHNYDYIALAQHQNDTVETVLINLTRGTGIAGLHGILPKRETLIRPILFLNKEEIDHIINQEQIHFREDQSNNSTKYARNKIRLEIIPILKELNPNLEETFANNSRRFGDLEHFLNINVDNIREKLFVSKNEDIHISINQLKDLNPNSFLMFEIFKAYNFSESVLQDLAASLDKQSGKLFESMSHQILIDREKLILQKKNLSTCPNKTVNLNSEIIEWGESKFKLHTSETTPISIAKNPNLAYFDESLLQFPLKFRQWYKGDYFYPFGMKGKKKISDFFTALKIPLIKKNTIPILENGNGDIIWVAGYRIDDRYKVSSSSKKVIIFEKY